MGDNNNVLPEKTNGQGVNGNATTIGFQRQTYADFLPEGPLRDRLKRLIRATPTDLTGLYQEIAFYTAMSEEAVAMYGAADSLEDAREKIKLKLQAMQMFDKAAARKESLSLSAARIDQHNRTSDAVHMANAIISEAIHIAKETLREYCPPEMLQHYARKLQDAFKIEDGQGEAGVHNAHRLELIMQEIDDVTHVNIPEPISPEPIEETHVQPKPRDQHTTPEVIRSVDY